MNVIHPLNEGAWSEWVEWRKVEKKKKIGPIAEQKQQQMLMQYPPNIQQEIIDTSIMNSWQGLFPPKNGFKQNSMDKANENAAKYLAKRNHIAGWLE